MPATSPRRPCTTQPTWFEHLASFGALQALAIREAQDPLEAVNDPAQMSLLAEALLGETRAPEEREVAGALQELHERAIEAHQRGLRTEIAEAERRGDFTELALLTQKKLELDRALRALQGRRSSRFPEILKFQLNLYAFNSF